MCQHNVEFNGRVVQPWTRTCCSPPSRRSPSTRCQSTRRSPTATRHPRPAARPWHPPRRTASSSGPTTHRRGPRLLPSRRRTTTAAISIQIRDTGAKGGARGRWWWRWQRAAARAMAERRAEFGGLRPRRIREKSN